MKKSSVLLLPALLTGAALGAAAALLLTPKTGKDLRKEIKGKSDEIIGSGNDYLNKLKDKSKNIFAKKEESLDKLLSEHKKGNDSNGTGNGNNKDFKIPIEEKINVKK